MSEADDLVSVIIPAYNAAPTLEDTIASISAQTHRNMDIIVIDDGSTDNTFQVALELSKRDTRITIVQQDNRGQAVARNSGIAHARGRFIAPLDADDLWHPTILEKQVSLLARASRHVGLVTCWGRAVDERCSVLFDLAKINSRGRMLAHFILRNFNVNGCGLFRREAIEEVGGYDETLATRGGRCCEDLKLNLAVAERYDVEVVPEYLMAYRMRPGSSSSATNSMANAHQIVIAETRALHPELPEKLYRWADALSSWEYGRNYLRRGEWKQGVRSLARSISRDPSSAMNEALAALSKRSNRRQIIGRNFFDMDTREPSIPFSTAGFLRASRLAELEMIERSRARPSV